MSMDKHQQQLPQMFDTFVKATRHSSTSVKTLLQNLLKRKKVFNPLLCSVMLLEIHLRPKNLSNISATSMTSWGIFDFNRCTGLEAGKYIWAFGTMVCFVVGFPASTAILWELFKTYRRGIPFTPNDFFILNLTVMDGVFLVFLPPGIINHFIWENSSYEACWNSLYALSTCGRPLMMACVCVDCYVAVVHPITYHKRKSLTPRVVMAGIVWALTVATGIAYFYFNALYFTMFPIALYITAILIIGIFDSFILHTLIKSDPGRENIHPQKQRAIQTLISSLVITVLSYLPPVLLFAIVWPLTSLDIYICVVGIPVSITSSVGSAVMPILHLKNQGKLDCLRLGYCRRS